MPFFEASAKENINIAEAFEALAQSVNQSIGKKYQVEENPSIPSLGQKLRPK